MDKRVLLGVQKKKPIKQSNKKFLKKVADYLISDSYMYAPLISPPPPEFRAPKTIGSPSTGPLWYLKRVTAAIRARKTNKKNNQPIKQPENSRVVDLPIEGCDPETCILGQQTFGHREMVKHMVHENCCPLSVLGNSVQNIKYTTSSAPVVTNLVAAKSA